MTTSQNHASGADGDADESLHALVKRIRRWAWQLGFQQVGISDIDLAREESQLADWLAAGHHGEMAYMARHGLRRSRPAELIPGTCRVICVRMDYLPAARPWQEVLDQPEQAYVSRYALGRDYHKLMRQRLKRLAEKIRADRTAEKAGRVFVDSAPVLEKPLARKAGLGWIGKHTNLISTQAGSWFFLGEIFTDLPLPVDPPAVDHCGRCRACIDVCPTSAIIAPYRLDARRCISYLTIELAGSIPTELRPLIGNRIYGCDDCQLVCPWNRFARPTGETDFQPRNRLDSSRLCELFAWSEAEFLQYTLGSAIRRIGHVSWLRNIAVAMGNILAGRAPAVDRGLLPAREHDTRQTTTAIMASLRTRSDHPSDIVREHVGWALKQAQTNGH